MQSIVNICFIILTVAYPMLVFRSFEYDSAIKIGIAVVAAMKILNDQFSAGRKSSLVRLQPLFLLCILAADFFFISNLEIKLFYPVIVNTSLCILFLGSLYSPASFIERLARIKEPDLSLHGVAYTRKVTQIWASFFLFNIILNLILIFSKNHYAWMLYNSIVSYILMAFIFSLEFIVRQKFKKKWG